MAGDARTIRGHAAGAPHRHEGGPAGAAGEESVEEHARVREEIAAALPRSAGVATKSGTSGRSTELQLR